MKRSNAVNSSFCTGCFSWHQTNIKMAKPVLFAFVVLTTVCLSKQFTIIDSDYLFVQNSGNFQIRVDNIEQKTVFTLQKFGRIVHRMHLSENFGKNFSTTDIANGFILHGFEEDVKIEIVDDSDEYTLVKVSSVLRPDQKRSHCGELATGHLNWFGGPQIFHQYWPVEKLKLEDYSYVPKQQDNVGVAERYWLNSRGGFIYVDDKVPLFIDQNIYGNTICLKVKNELPYNTRRTSIKFVYHLGVGRDARAAHRKAVERFLKKPTAVADRRMVQHPIWSTWARYKADINESTVEVFASEIEKYGFNNSQLEIDDDWEVCYGALTFRDSKFPNIRKQTDDLKARGFRITLWIHPFINKGCEPWYSEAKERGYVKISYF